MTLSKSKKCMLRARDYAILHFLWRWRVSTTAVISSKFFSRQQDDSSYSRLRKLKNGKYIQCHCFDTKDHRYVWTLTSKGYEAISKSLGDLREGSFESKAREHDLYVSACLLGEWLVNAPADVSVFSDQEIQAISIEQFPLWVPKATLHLPDGYWRVPYDNAHITIALEVEKTIKAASRYEVIAKFYRDIPSIYRVVWVVNTLGEAKQIQNKITEVVGSDSDKHLFLFLRDLKKDGWLAKFQLGIEQNFTLGYLLGFDGAVNPALLKNRSSWSTFKFFNTAKRPFKSTIYTNVEEISVSDKVAIPATPYSQSITNQKGVL